jgi:hypothetical protein
MKRLRTLAALTALAAGAPLGAAGGLATAAGSARTANLPTIRIAMDGHSIDVGGTLQSGAVDVVSTTTDERAANPVLVRLNSGVTAEQLLAFLATPAAKDPNNIRPYGSIVFDATAFRGTSDIQTRLRPANYVALDIEGNGPDGPPHMTFTITRAAHPATLPGPDATVGAIDFAFRGDRKFHRDDLVRFKNRGNVVHMVAALQARNARSAKRIVRALRAGKDRRARRLGVGVGTNFMLPTSTGAVQQMKPAQQMKPVGGKPGIWVLACFMTTQDGRDHTQLGMERIVHIAR